MQINSSAFQVSTSDILPNGGQSGLYCTLFPKPLQVNGGRTGKVEENVIEIGNGT